MPESMAPWRLAEREEEPDGQVPAAVRHRKSFSGGDGDEATRASCGVASQAPTSLQSLASRTDTTIHSG